MPAVDVLTAPLETALLEPARRYSLIGGRCAADVVATAAGIAWWRARLDVTDVQLDLGAAPSLVARVGTRSRFTSIPFTRRRIVRSVPTDELLTLTVSELPGAPELSMRAATAYGQVTIADRTWVVSVALRLVANEGDRLVLALTGTIVRDEAAPLVVPHLGFDAAAELVRCE